MSFAADLVTDRDDVFLSTLEFAESVSYRVAATDTTTAGIIAEIEDENDDELSDGLRVRVSAGVITSPAKGDQVIHSGATYTVVMITEEVGMYTLECEREEEIQ